MTYRVNTRQIFGSKRESGSRESYTTLYHAVRCFGLGRWDDRLEKGEIAGGGRGE